jgi:hypothetical protein
LLLTPSINKVPHKHIRRIRHLPSKSEQLHQVIELAVDITANGDWGGYGLHVAFLQQVLFHLRMRKGV